MMFYKIKIKMNILMVLIPCFLYMGCEKSKTENVSIHFKDSNPEIQLNEMKQLDIIYKEGYDEKDYDNESNPLGLEWSVTDEDVLNVSQDGKVEGKGIGGAFVKAK